jgi:outer membrane protein
MHSPKTLVITTLLASLVASLPNTARAQDEPVVPAAPPGLRPMRVEECVATALERNVDVKGATEEVTASEATRSSVAGQFGPKVRVDASVTQWTVPYVVLGFPVHDAFVWNATATLTQPISALFAIYDLYKVSDLGVDIASIKRQATRRETAFKVVESYYRLLQAERLVEVAQASVDQLDGQLRQAKSFHANGVVSLDDVLRAQLAVANAQQRLIQMRSRVGFERSRLAVLVGLPADTAIGAEPLRTDQPLATDVTSMDQAERTAELQRVELREVDRRIDQGAANVRLAKLHLAPQINGVASYIHNEGSLFSQINSAYIGATASWDVWDWGTTTSGISVAKAHHQQAILARTKLSDQIRLEVRKAFADVGAANEAMSVAKAQVAAAEENFRLVKKRYEANAATSFAVVDAEGLLTQARGQLQTALYDFVVSRAALRNAMGAAPEAIARP